MFRATGSSPNQVLLSSLALLDHLNRRLGAEFFVLGILRSFRQEYP